MPTEELCSPEPSIFSAESPPESTECESDILNVESLPRLRESQPKRKTSQNSQQKQKTQKRVIQTEQNEM
jgi:hypothetical protein